MSNNLAANNTEITTETITTISPHPYAELLPVLGGIEAQVLIEDIKHNGLRFPIWLFEGKILDGRNRYAACRVAGVEPRFVEYEGDDPLGFVISANLHRRHLSLKDRDKLITTLLVWRPEFSDRQIAKLSKINRRAVTKAREGLEEAGDVVQKSHVVDTKGRQQPRQRQHKPRSKTKVQPKPIQELSKQEAADSLKVSFQGMADRVALWNQRHHLKTGDSWADVVELIRRPEPTSEGLPLVSDDDEPAPAPPHFNLGGVTPLKL